MTKRCLYCYKTLSDGFSGDYHSHCSESFFGTPEPPLLNYTMEDMTVLAQQVVERSIAVPGVQPKLSLTLVRDAINEGNHNGLTVVGALGGNYIFKPPSPYFPQMPENEHVTMRIAESFGLRVVPSSLIRLKSGELSYITRRIDRTASGEKIHMLDMFQLLEAVDKYKSSMERIGKAIQSFSENTLLDLGYFFEMTVFSFLTGNNDMHLKNFSLIHNNGTWQLSPAYDLLNVTLSNPADPEELALPLEGKKKKLKREHFDRLGTDLGLTQKQVNNTMKRLQLKRPDAIEWIDHSFLSQDFKEKYKEIMAVRYGIMGL
jgi:serine/threonine-protein kinase HipA